MKLLFFAIFALSIVRNGQSDMIAIANVHVDSTQIGIGTVIFHQRDATTPIRVFGVIDSLKPNTVHGFHVHRDGLGKDELNCSYAGPHFNPYEKLHGPRDAHLDGRHVGDLGNVTANENGIIFIEIMDNILDLYNATRSIANRTIVLHAMRDDGGTGGFPDSKTTGDAGARIACGVISFSPSKPSAMSDPSKASMSVRNFMSKLFP